MAAASSHLQFHSRAPFPPPSAVLNISHRTYLLGPDFVGTVFVLSPTSVPIPICRFTSELLH
jgi:hypothetical protein